MDSETPVKPAKPAPILFCTNCGSGFFYQIERRVTGVVIDEGAIIVQEPKKMRAVTYFTCRRCGCIVPKERVAGFKYKSQFPQPSSN